MPIPLSRILDLCGSWICCSRFFPGGCPRIGTLDSRRFGLRGARHGRDATSRRVYERGRMYEGLGAGSLSRRWDYASERSAAKSHVWDGWRQQGLGRPKWAVAPAWANRREPVDAVVRAAKSFQSRVDRNRQESTGIELQRVALRTRFTRLWEVADWSFAPHRHTRLLSIPADSRRFDSSRARRGLLFAGHGVTAPPGGESRLRGA